MTGKDALQRWWDGLSEEERAQALRARDGDRASGELLKSLRRAGLLKDPKNGDESIPDDIDIFLKARH